MQIAQSKNQKQSSVLDFRIGLLDSFIMMCHDSRWHQCAVQWLHQVMACSLLVIILHYAYIWQICNSKYLIVCPSKFPGQHDYHYNTWTVQFSITSNQQHTITLHSISIENLTASSKEFSAYNIIFMSCFIHYFMTIFYTLIMW